MGLKNLQSLQKAKIITLLILLHLKSSGIRQSKITKEPVLAVLGGKGLSLTYMQFCPVNPFPGRGFPLMSKIVWC